MIFIGPNLQIFSLTYFLSTASGSHLLHIMMANCVLWPARGEQKWSIVVYMVAGGIPAPVDDHPGRIAELALDMLAEMERFQSIGGKLDVRIGFHTGPVIAGVIGHKKFSYDVWGDTVNTASRMESHGVPSRIHVSAQAYEILRNRYLFEERGIIEIKGIGQMRTYFLSGRWI